MDAKSLGTFMQLVRKEKGLTQKELAERICVSDKTISKWENGNSMPDTSILMDLCRELDISVNELLRGERILPEAYPDKAEETIVCLLQENEGNKKQRKIQYFFGTFLLICTVIMAGLGVEAKISWFFDIPTFLIMLCGCVGMVFISGKRDAVGVVSVLRRTVIPFGALVSLISMVALMGKLSSPEKIGPNLAMVILSLIYSIVIYLVLLLWDVGRSRNGGIPGV